MSGPALSSGEDFELRLRDTPRLAVDVGEGVIAVGGSHEEQDPFGPLSDRDMPARRKDDVRQVCNGLLQSWVGADGVLPYLVGVRRQVNLAVGVSVEDARALVVEIDDGLVVGLVLKERLVGANHLGVLMKPGTDPFSQLDDALHTVGGQKGVAQYLLRMLSDAIDAARPLDEPYDGPGQVVVHDD